MTRLKKRTKHSRMPGKNMGSHGHGARKKAKGSGHRGGIGMSGSGKRADHKKTLVQKLYGHTYFGKQGVTSRKTQRDMRQRINVGDIQLHLEKYGKKTAKGFDVALPAYKILGDGKVKDSLFITAKEASKTALEKVKAAGGAIILPSQASPKKEEKPIKEKLEKA